jgi:hypothetical protein
MRASFNIPDTAMASAFLDALVDLVGTPHHPEKVVLPTGTADVDEVERVLRGLGLIRDDRRAR